MTPREWMETNGKTQAEIADEFGVTQSAISKKLAGNKWTPEEALHWEKFTGNKVTRDDVLYPELTKKVAGG